MKKILLIILMALPFLANAQVLAPGSAEPSFATYLTRTGWTATANSGNGGDGPYAGLFDGDPATYWNSNYGNAATNFYPHILTIDMLSDQSYGGVMIRPRSGGARVPQSITFRKSDDGTTWTDIATVTAVNQVKDQLFFFSTTHTGRYLQVELTNTYSADINGELAEIAPFTTSIVDPTAYSRIGWVATGNNTQGIGGTGDAVGYAATIDNDATTYWHTRYNAGDATSQGTAVPFPSNQIPVTLEYDMLQTLTINKLSFLNRNPNGNRHFKAFTVSYKVNSGDAWTTLPQTFALENENTQLSRPLGTTINARYIKLDITESGNNANTMLAEFRTHYDAVLPVELTSFTAKSNGSSVGLKWTTATESDASHFDVTRSTDGSSFASIGKVTVTGSGSTYNYTDFSPVKGNNYYQLVSVDNDGTSKKSSVEVAKIAANGNELTVTATTASGVTVNVYASKATTGTITASNVTGQKITTQAVKLAEGNNTVTVSTNAKGLIILSLNTAEGTLSKKIIK
ncbi:MAG: discoidin domain-containing protein [Pedobacter sp.]|uniref:discoidin domain-containing protein n=1 Tax=Pedobacter sp. TaxID=1411316 RepID=UPI002807F73D|nr:discoidin domain-containing protein [Pedobacter sp.]MDQ8003278.1 discoidin domain-containing protein [Pedobacter sp.]